jgi:hypothetical protein
MREVSWINEQVRRERERERGRKREGGMEGEGQINAE